MPNNITNLKAIKLALVDKTYSLNRAFDGKLYCFKTLGLIIILKDV